MLYRRHTDMLLLRHAAIDMFRLPDIAYVYTPCLRVTYTSAASYMLLDAFTPCRCRMLLLDTAAAAALAAYHIFYAPRAATLPLMPCCLRKMLMLMDARATLWFAPRYARDVSRRYFLRYAQAAALPAAPRAGFDMRRALPALFSRRYACYASATLALGATLLLRFKRRCHFCWPLRLRHADVAARYAVMLDKAPLRQALMLLIAAVYTPMLYTRRA